MISDLKLKELKEDLANLYNEGVKLFYIFTKNHSPEDYNFHKKNGTLKNFTEEELLRSS